MPSDDRDEDTGATSDETRERKDIEQNKFDLLGRTAHRTVDRTKGGRFKQSWSNTSSDESDGATSELTSRRHLKDRGSSRGTDANGQSRGKGHTLLFRKGAQSDIKPLDGDRGVALTPNTEEDLVTGNDDFEGSMTKTETQDTLLLSPEISTTRTGLQSTFKTNEDSSLPSSVGSCHSSDHNEPEPGTQTSVSGPALQNHQRLNVVDSLPLRVITPPPEVAVRVRNGTLPRVRRRRTVSRKPSLSPTGVGQTGAGTRSVSVGSVYFENPVFSRADEEAETAGETFGCVSSKAQSMANISLRNLLTPEPSSSCRNPSPYRASRSVRLRTIVLKDKRIIASSKY